MFSDIFGLGNRLSHVTDWGGLSRKCEYLGWKATSVRLGWCGFIGIYTSARWGPGYGNNLMTKIWVHESYDWIILVSKVGNSILPGAWRISLLLSLCERLFFCIRLRFFVCFFFTGHAPDISVDITNNGWVTYYWVQSWELLQGNQVQTHWRGVKGFCESWFKHRGNTFPGLTLSFAVEIVLEKNLDIKENL